MSLSFNDDVAFAPQVHRLLTRELAIVPASAGVSRYADMLSGVARYMVNHAWGNTGKGPRCAYLSHNLRLPQHNIQLYQIVFSSIFFSIIFFNNLYTIHTNLILLHISLMTFVFYHATVKLAVDVCESRIYHSMFPFLTQAYY